MNQIATAVVSKLDRADLLAILADAPETVLRGAVAGLLNGTPVEPQVSTETPKPGPAKTKPGQVKATPVAAKAGDVSPADAVKALAPDGFAMGELAALTGLDAKSSALKTAIKHAIDAKELHRFGERRLMRYGATAAIAKKRSEGDRKGA